MILDGSCFSVNSIDVLVVGRDKGTVNSCPAGRLKHSFLYTIRGCMLYSFGEPDRAPITADCGEAVFLPAGTVHMSEYREDGTEVGIIQFELSGGELPADLTEPFRLNLPGAGELFGRFFDAKSREAAAEPLYCTLRLYEILWAVEELHTRQPFGSPKLQPALAELRAHFAENQPVSRYAELCGMSEPGFRRLFVETCGVPPVTYRNNLRLTEARKLLQSGEFNVSEAAETTGFSNLSFFIRLYRKKYGRTPGRESDI